jgi:GNAT superfamily N-acetyltransferase
VEYRIRPATPADSLGAVETVKAVYEEYSFTWEEDGYHADLYQLGDYYLAKGNLFAVAEGKSGVVGTIALEFFEVIPGSSWDVIEYDGKLRIAGTDCALNRLYVSPSSRRKGLAMALCAYVINEAKSRNCRAMEIWSDKRFEAAHDLYGRLGARVVGERICDDPDVSPEWGLVLPLTSQKSGNE